MFIDLYNWEFSFKLFKVYIFIFNFMEFMRLFHRFDFLHLLFMCSLQ